MRVWDEVKAITRDTETTGQINGVSAYLEKFSFLFGVVLGELILAHSDNLSKSLQVKVLIALEGQIQAELTLKTPESIRTEEMFGLFWLKVLKMAKNFEVEQQTLLAFLSSNIKFTEMIFSLSSYIFRMNGKHLDLQDTCKDTQCYT